MGRAVDGRRDRGRLPQVGQVVHGPLECLDAAGQDGDGSRQLFGRTQQGGDRRVALAGAKIRWEAGPAAGPPDWNLLQPQHRPGARAAFDAFERRQRSLEKTRAEPAPAAGSEREVA